jgi:uncharacterized Tic20 family protein
MAGRVTWLRSLLPVLAIRHLPFEILLLPSKPISDRLVHGYSQERARSTEMDSAIRTALIVIAVMLLLGWLLRSVKSEARVDGDKQWLEYGRTMKGFAIFTVAIVVVLAGFLFQTEQANLISICGLTLSFVCLSLPLVIEFLFVRIAFNSENIYCFSGWRKSRVIPWAHINSCTFSHINKWWILDAGEHGKIRIHEFLSGREAFFKALSARTGILA